MMYDYWFLNMTSGEIEKVEELLKEGMNVSVYTDKRFPWGKDAMRQTEPSDRATLVYFC